MDAQGEPAPGELLLTHIQAHLDALERDDAANTALTTATDDAARQTTANDEEPLTQDPALHELLQMRITRARQTPGAVTPDTATQTESPATIAAAEDALRDLARRYGAARGAASMAAQERTRRDAAPTSTTALWQRRLDIHQRWLSDAEDTELAIAAASERRDNAASALSAALQDPSMDAGRLRDLLRQDRAALASAPGLSQAQRQTLDAALRDVAALAGEEDAARGAAQSVSRALADVQSNAAREADERREALTKRAAQGTPQSSEAMRAEIAEGATEDAPERVQRVLTQRLMRRATPRTFSTLPDLSATRVFTQESAERPAFSEAFDSADGRRRQGESMWGQVQRRLARHGDPRGGRASQPRDGAKLARLGRHMESSVQRLSQQMRSASAPPISRAGAPSPDLAGGRMPAPRLRGMPGNVFADLSSTRMQRVYSPVLSRVTGRAVGRSVAPRARLNDIHDRQMTEIARDLDDPRVLYAALLGEPGQRLAEEQPEVADRLQASLKPVAALMPRAGAHGFEPMRRYTEQMRRQVETWMGEGSRDGVERGRAQPVLNAQGGAARSIGDYIGGPFAIDARGAGEATNDVVRQQAEEVENRLLHERTTLDPRLVKQVGQMLGKKVTRQVTAFAGPTASQIASEMGARAFSIGSAVFLPTNASAALKGHEITHALLHDGTHSANADDHPRKIEDEERVAYGVEGALEQGQKAVDAALQRTVDRMPLAKEQNIPPMRMPNEPGGVTGTSLPDPGQRQASPKDQALKETQIIEAVTDAVEMMIQRNATVEQERFGRIS